MTFKYVHTFKGIIVPVDGLETFAVWPSAGTLPAHAALKLKLGYKLDSSGCNMKLKSHTCYESNIALNADGYSNCFHLILTEKI